MHFSDKTPNNPRLPGEGLTGVCGEASEALESTSKLDIAGEGWEEQGSRLR